MGFIMIIVGLETDIAGSDNQGRSRFMAWLRYADNHQLFMHLWLEFWLVMVMRLGCLNIGAWIFTAPAPEQAASW